MKGLGMMRLRPVRALALLATALTLPACGNFSHGTDASAVVARVNGTAITADQVKQAMPPLSATASDADRKAASKAVLDALIQQEMLAQKAKEAKLDREPEVMLAMESAKRAVLADQWLKHSVGDAPAPSDQDIKDYIANHPEMFSQRKQYNFRVAAVQGNAADIAKIQEDTAKSHNFDASLQYLRDHQMKYAVSEQSRTGDQFPSDVLRKINDLKEGGEIAFPNGDHLEIAQLVSVKPAPVAVQGADPRVANLLTSQATNQRAQSALKMLAGSAKIELMGDFKQSTASTKAPGGTTAPKVISSDVEMGIAAGLK